MADTEHTIDSILGIAIRLEERSEEIYRQASEMAGAPGATALLSELADEEVRHRELLLEVRGSGDHRRIGAGPAPLDIKVADHLDTPPLDADSTIQDVLLYAIRREQQAVELYTRMLDVYAGTDAESVLERLVAEERRHKERLQHEYDEVILSDN